MALTFWFKKYFFVSPRKRMKYIVTVQVQMLKKLIMRIISAFIINVSIYLTLQFFICQIRYVTSRRIWS